MNLPEDYTNPTPDDLIEAFLDGMLAPEDRERVLEAAREHREFAERLAFARSIREALRSMPAERAPEEVVPEVIRIARREARRDAIDRVQSLFGRISGLDVRPALAMATLVLVVVAAGLMGRPGDPEIDPEVAEALEQIKWTLALVSDVGDRTVQHLRVDVIEPHVVGNMQRAMREVFDEPQ